MGARPSAGPPPLRRPRERERLAPTGAGRTGEEQGQWGEPAGRPSLKRASGTDRISGLPRTLLGELAQKEGRKVFAPPTGYLATSSGASWKLVGSIFGRLGGPLGGPGVPLRASWVPQVAPLALGASW
eukprot:1438840-Pyramimonas_sp.AAC.1